MASWARHGRTRWPGSCASATARSSCLVWTPGGTQPSAWRDAARCSRSWPRRQQPRRGWRVRGKGGVMPRFDWPWFLAALALLPLLARSYRRRAQAAPSLRFARGVAATPLPRTRRQRWRQLPMLLRLTALALLIVALAGPRLSGRRVREINRSTGLQLVVDCSGSMLARDMVFRGKPAARIDVVRELSRDFVFGDGAALKGRPLDMIGVIAFGEEPITLCPLTLAHDNLRPVLDAVRVGSGADGTAIGDAVAAAAARFRRAETAAGQKFKSTAIILLTDGDNNSGSHTVQDAAGLAAQWGGARVCHRDPARPPPSRGSVRSRHERP